MKLRALTAVTLICLTLAGCSPAPSKYYRFTTVNRVGGLIDLVHRKPAAEFDGRLLTGATFTLSQDRGKVTVINFWATWCLPCGVETPQFDTVYRAYRDRGVTFLGIDTKDSPESKVRDWVSSYRISYPILFDEDGRTAISLGDIPAQGLPFTVLLDRHSRVAGVYITKLAPKDLEPMIDKLLAEPT